MPRSLVPNQFDYAGIYVEGKRNRFRFHKPVLSAGCSGMLRPLGDPIPAFPGTKFDLKSHMVIQSNTMVVPPLDGMYLDVFAVWVPHRIVWTHMPQFLGENDTTAWTQSLNLSYPSITFGLLNRSLRALFNDDSLSDIDLGNLFLSPQYGIFDPSVNEDDSAIYGKNINILAYRGYYAIWNHFFRDENYQRPVLFSKGDIGNSGEFGYCLLNYLHKGLGSFYDNILNADIGVGVTFAKALLMPVNKFHDAFTSLLPQPQFGNAVEIGLAGTAPVNFFGASSLGSGYTNLQIGEGSSVSPYGASLFATPSGTRIGVNAIADLSQASGVNINQLRASVMYQRYLEALARGGRRVPEFYEVIYGVKNSDVLKDYPRMLSHTRYQLSVNQVVATADSSGSGWSSHLGDRGGYSLSNLRDIPLCEFEATEFGYIHILYCVRADNRYSQAVPEHFFRSSLMDEYNPFFDHIGDVGVPSYMVNSSADTDTNFGYQEAWWFIRTQIGLTTGPLNKNYGSLSYWTLGEKFDSSLVVCTPSYLVFNPAVMNDNFISNYDTYPQFVFDSLIFGKVAGRISQRSIPGIVGRI